MTLTCNSVRLSGRQTADAVCNVPSLALWLSIAGGFAVVVQAEDGRPPIVLDKPARVYHVDATPQDGGLHIRSQGVGIATLEWALDQSVGPHVFEFRLRSSRPAELGDYYVKWIDSESRRRHSFERVPIIPDGNWHTYRLPIGNRSRIKAVQLTLGTDEHALELSSVRLLPASIATSLDENKPLSIASDRLELQFLSSTRRLRIIDRVTGREWVSEPISSWLSLLGFERLSESSMEIQLRDNFADAALRAAITLEGEECTFRVVPDQPTQRLEAARRFPPFFSTNMDQGELVFCNRSGGTIVDQSDASHAHWPLRVYGNLHCLDMPWMGLTNDVQRDGLMVQIDTPFDAEVALVRDLAGRHWPQIHWLPERDKFGYPRQVTYHFAADGGYVGLAKAYRSKLVRAGRLNRLDQKRIHKPELERLKGAPSLWGWPRTQEFINEMRPLGVMRGVVNSCENPELVETLHEQGFLTGAYDNYSDFRAGPVRYQSDSPEESAVIPRPGGGFKLGWKPRNGDTLYWRSSAQWKRAEDRYVDQHLSHTNHSSRFIDVAAASELTEDYHADHPMSRRDDYQNRRELFQRMNQRNLVVGAEFGNDWVMSEVDFLEGAMSGPHWWSSWPAGHLDTPTRDQLSELYLQFGMGYEHRVPLWELVYHDCAVSTWYWGDTAGILYQSAPEIADRKDLFNMLYGTAPLIWMNNTGYRYPDQTDRMLQTYHETTHLHALVAFAEMVDHEFLSQDRTVQRTRFSNGAEVTVNFSGDAREIATSSGSVRLAPFGYYVKSSEIEQARIVGDSSVETTISTPKLLLVESDGNRAVKNVQFAGRMTAFQFDENQWNLVCDRAGPCLANVTAFTGWDPTDQLVLFTMSADGTPGTRVATADSQGTIEFEAADDSRRFVIQRLRTDPNQLTREEEASGFVSLFNGTDLVDWSHSGNWVVQNASIFREQDGGFLTYAPKPVPDNFELRFEWKVASGSNSGVHYRPTQYEYQILDNDSHADGSNPRTSAGALYFCMAPGRDVTRPVGQWNTGRIICQGTVIQHWLNGEKIVHFDYADPRWSEEVDLLRRLGGDLTARGQHLALQDHNDPVWFRALRMRTLGPDEPIDLSEVIPMYVSPQNRRKEEEIINWRLQNLTPREQNSEEPKDGE